MKENNLKDIRTKQKISISDLSRKSGISERYLRFIEAGEKNPSLQTAQKIALALDKTTDEIFLPEKLTFSTFWKGLNSDENAKKEIWFWKHTAVCI